MTTRPLILTGTRLFDGTTSEAQEGRAVVIEDGRIAGVVARGEIPAESDHRRIDLPGTTVLPGLVDMHVHLCDWSAPGSVVRDPARLSADEVTAEVKAIVAELGAKGPGDMGKVMGAVKAKLAGKADMGQVSAAVKAALAG